MDEDVTPSPLTDDKVRDHLRVLFPRALGDNPLDRNATVQFGHAFHAGLVSALREADPEKPATLAMECRTWGDVFDWYGEALLSSSAKPFGRAGASAGSRVILRPVAPADVPQFYEAACDPEHGYRWRFRGRTPGFEEFQSSFFDGVLCQYTVANPDNGDPVGVCVAYNADMASQQAYFAFLALPRRSAEQRLAMIEGAALFVNHLFRTFPLRRLLMELPAYNSPLIADLITWGIATELARIPDYYHHNSEWHDHLICGITRQDWSRVEHWFQDRREA